ncbi:MAG TPA: tail fiber protein, partial [Fimbriimonadaceae bacterium]|nr:tail fiber protein [Fimbriimonadaceae bacterium]
MADNYIGEIRVVAFNFAPVGWAQCDGQILPISQNTALFSLLGTQYGGNGTSNFALPDFQGRIAVGQGQAPGLSSYVPGQEGGSETVTLTTAEMPSHNHRVAADQNLADSTVSALGALAVPNIDSRFQNLYQDQEPNANAGPLSTVGGGQPHENRQPFQVNMVIIA